PRFLSLPPLFKPGILCAAAFTVGANPVTALARCLAPGKCLTAFLICLRPFLPSAPRYVARPTAKAVAACSATVGACLFTNFLRVFWIALRVFFFSIAMIHSSPITIRLQQRFG